MPFLKQGQTVVTREPTLLFEPERDTGPFSFSLIVVDEKDVESSPATVQVEVRLR